MRLTMGRTPAREYSDSGEEMIPLLTNNPDAVAGEGYISPEVMDEYSKSPMPPYSQLADGEGWAVGTKGTSVVSGDESTFIPGATAGVTQPQEKIPPKPDDIDMKVGEDWLNFWGKFAEKRYGKMGDPRNFDIEVGRNRTIDEGIEKYGDDPRYYKLIKDKADKVEADMKAAKKDAQTEYESIRKMFFDEHKQKLTDIRQAKREEALLKRQEEIERIKQERENWTIHDTADGLVRVNKNTGEVVPMGVKGKQAAEKGQLTESSVLASFGQRFYVPSKAAEAYDTYRKYIKDGSSRESAYNETLKYMDAKYPKLGTSQPAATVPKDAKTGTYKGTRAYTTDGKTFFSMDGKRLN
jgi:hypothetical protein